MKKALLVALCVGSILLTINQFEALFKDQELNFVKLLLTYMVPFFVYTLGQRAATKKIPTLPEQSLPANSGPPNFLFERLTEIQDISLKMNNLATQVNQASNSRMEIATQTQDKVKEMVTDAETLELRLKSIFGHFLTLSNQTDKTMGRFGELVEQVKLAARWSQQHSQQLNAFHDVFKQLSSRAESISNVSKQTQLLSINASIEAAKAEKAGRGFSVVADEMKSLSDNTHRLSNQILQDITAMNRGVLELVSSTTKVKTDLEKGVNKVLDGESDVSSLQNLFSEKLTTTEQEVSHISTTLDGMLSGLRSIRTGMVTLFDGTKASISGSSQNMQFSSDTNLLLEQVFTHLQQAKK